MPQALFATHSVFVHTADQVHFCNLCWSSSSAVCNSVCIQHFITLEEAVLALFFDCSCYAGTFLYASCIHILPEILGDRSSLTLVELGAVLFGGLLPIIFAALHGDHHH